MLTRQQLIADLHALGLRPGDVVMVHASLRAIGEIAGGPDEVHLAIKDVITPDGALFMYASCPAYVDEVGRATSRPSRKRKCSRTSRRSIHTPHARLATTALWSSFCERIRARA